MSDADLIVAINGVNVPDQYKNSFSYTSVYNIDTSGNGISGYSTIASYGAKNHLLNSDICGPIWNQQKCGSCWYMVVIQQVLEKGVMKKIQDNNENFPSQTTNIGYLYGITGETLDGYWGELCICGGGFYPLALAILRKLTLMPAAPSTYTPTVVSNTRIAEGCKSSSYDCCVSLPTYPGSPPSQAIDIFTDEYTIQSANDCFTYISPDGVYQIISNTVSNEEFQKLLYQYGPAVVSVNANSWNSDTYYLDEDQAYKPSSFSYKSGVSPDHDVQIVGWRVRTGKLYWQLRNQWSENWGWKGYIFVEAGDNILDCVQAAYFLMNDYVDLGSYNSPTNGADIVGSSIGNPLVPLT